MTWTGAEAETNREKRVNPVFQVAVYLKVQGYPRVIV
jgi:hypothetical protein